MENIQNDILRIIYWKGKETTVDEIMKETSLKRAQIHRALDNLMKRTLIIKKTEQPGWTNGKWHSRKSFIKLRRIQFAEQYLRKRGLI